jgi:DNA oxidative demethylase
MSIMIKGVHVYPGHLGLAAQLTLVAELRGLLVAAPLFRSSIAGGKQMSVRMSSAGRFGWVSDHRGARYETRHPATGAAWPAIPDPVLAIWRAIAAPHLRDPARLPDSCLINWYDADARMGLHQDRDEGDFGWPVLSISLGDEALFRVGGTTRSDRTESLWLRSGDVVLMAGAARLCFHGIDRIRPGSSNLLPRGGRINLTCRVVS